MGLAWEISEDDIAIVRLRNGIEGDSGRLFEEHFVSDIENCFRVGQAALAHADFDDQCDAALDEITAILIEAGVISI